MIFLIVIFPFIALSNSLTVTSELNKTKGLIGDRIIWTIKVENLGSKTVRLPELEVNNDSLSVKHLYSKSNTTTINDFAKSFEIINWDTGSYKTPDYRIDVLNDYDELDYSIPLDPIDYKIVSILDSAGNKDFLDIKGPVPVQPLFPTDTIIYSFCLIFSILFIIILMVNKEKIDHNRVHYTSHENLNELAIQKFMDVDNSILARDYYSSISYIIRELIERKYFIRTLEMTCEEISHSREIFPFNDIQFEKLVEILTKADVVKYARETPNEKVISADKKSVISLMKDI